MKNKFVIPFIIVAIFAGTIAFANTSEEVYEMTSASIVASLAERREDITNRQVNLMRQGAHGEEQQIAPTPYAASTFHGTPSSAPMTLPITGPVQILFILVIAIISGFTLPVAWEEIKIKCKKITQPHENV